LKENVHLKTPPLLPTGYSPLQKKCPFRFYSRDLSKEDVKLPLEKTQGKNNVQKSKGKHENAKKAVQVKKGDSSP
jgi:hypothetical protein